MILKIVLVVLISFLTRYIVYLAMSLIAKDKKSTKENLVPSVFRIMFNVSMVFLEIYTITNEKWIYHTEKYLFKPEKIPKSIECIYSIQIGFYISGMVFLLMEPKQKDFYMLFLHHIITLFLEFVSFKFNFVRFGILVMLIHDISDPFLEGGKISLYYKIQWLADIFFFFFAGTFVVLRAIVYPILILYPLFYFLYTNKLEKDIISVSLAVCLSIIFILDLIWSSFIFKLLFKILKGEEKAVRDTRDKK